MPMISIAASAGTGTDPTAGVLNLSFSPGATPVLKSTEEWTPGGWYESGAAWRADLGSPAGVGGTPLDSVGAGALFNSQYGFMFMGNGSLAAAYVPLGNSLAIRVDSVSSPLLKAFNYGNSSNRWDQIFDGDGSQILWSGNMLHTFFTLPGDAPAGDYSARFEVFVASTPFSGSTGFAQYDSVAVAATKNSNFESTFVEFEWKVIPEPSSAGLLGLALGAFAFRRRRP